MPLAWTQPASGCMTRRYPTASRNCGRCSTSSPRTARCWSWSTRRPRSARLPVTVARACGHTVAYLPGLAMRRIADLYPGNAKTDARDAFIIADAARTLPHALRRLDVSDDALAELNVLVGYDDEVAAEATRSSNRIRGLLTGIHPALERVPGPKAAHPSSWRSCPAAADRPGSAPPDAASSPRSPPNTHYAWAPNWATTSSPRSRSRPPSCPAPPQSTLCCLDSPKASKPCCSRKTVAAEVEEILDAHPLAQVLTSMPGIGVRTAALILLEIGDASAFKSAGHLAAYAGIAPVTHHSGSSIRGEHPARSGNRKLKRAFFLAAFAALSDPTSRAYYDRKPAEGKKHNAALICLARRRCDVLFAMLRSATPYRPPEPRTA